MNNPSTRPWRESLKSLGAWHAGRWRALVIAVSSGWAGSLLALQPVYYGYNYLDIKMQIESDLNAERLAQERIQDRQREQQVLNEARDAYWALVAAGRSDRKVQQAYAEALDRKDLRCLVADIISGNFSDKGPHPLLGLFAAPDVLFDGGILESAKPEYRGWAIALFERCKQRLSRGNTSLVDFYGAVLAGYAEALTLPEYAEYVKARNLAEYEASGLPYRMSPPDFFRYLLSRHSRSDADLERSRRALESHLGVKEVMALVEEVRTAPRDAQGRVMFDRQYATPTEQFGLQLTKRFPRAYAAIVARKASPGAAVGSVTDDVQGRWDVSFAALEAFEALYGPASVAASVAAIREHMPDYPYTRLIDQKMRPLPIKAGAFTVREETVGRAFTIQLGLREPERHLVGMALARLKSGRVADGEKLVADYMARFGRDRCLAALQDARFIGGLWYADARDRQDYELRFPVAADREELSRWQEGMRSAGGYSFAPWSLLHRDDQALFALWEQLLQGRAVLVAVRNEVTPEMAVWQRYQPGSSLTLASRAWIRGGSADQPSAMTLTALTLKASDDSSATLEIQVTNSKARYAPTGFRLKGRVPNRSPDSLARPEQGGRKSVWAEVDEKEWELKPDMSFEGYAGSKFLLDAPVPNRRAYEVSRETIRVAGQSLDCVVYSYVRSMDVRQAQGMMRVQLVHRIWTHPAIPVPGAESEAAGAFWITEAFKHRPGTVRETRLHRLSSVRSDRRGRLVGSVEESGYEAEVVHLDLKGTSGAGYSSGPDPEGVLPKWAALGRPPAGSRSTKVFSLNVGAAVVEVPLMAYAPSAEYSIDGDFSWSPQLAVFAQAGKISLTGDFGVTVPQARVAFFDSEGVMLESNSFRKGRVESSSAAIKFALILSDKEMQGYKLRRGARLDLGQLSDALAAKGLTPEFVGLRSRESSLPAGPAGLRP